jgi:hypothetical protein
MMKVSGVLTVLNNVLSRSGAIAACMLFFISVLLVTNSLHIVYAGIEVEDRTQRHTPTPSREHPLANRHIASEPRISEQSEDPKIPHQVEKVIISSAEKADLKKLLSGFTSATMYVVKEVKDQTWRDAFQLGAELRPSIDHVKIPNFLLGLLNIVFSKITL